MIYRDDWFFFVVVRFCLCSVQARVSVLNVGVTSSMNLKSGITFFCIARDSARGSNIICNL